MTTRPTRPQPVGNVVRDSEVRKERVALEDSPYTTQIWRQCGDINSIYQDPARPRPEEPGHDPEKC
ncbi:hypothetical protein Rmf_16420 [Roseomonas fluvialis]|uniref:Uncharacterized protein n=1 Tax=Roseomonas fluvialis TaxID=1750527 RepID=A0ABN6NZ61_9PROT|nr:hypothetical protein Rmf_16420 [Roseomonas fluvialis]